MKNSPSLKNIGPILDQHLIEVELTNRIRKLNLNDIQDQHKNKNKFDLNLNNFYILNYLALELLCKTEIKRIFEKEIGIQCRSELLRSGPSDSNSYIPVVSTHQRPNQFSADLVYRSCFTITTRFKRDNLDLFYTHHLALESRLTRFLRFLKDFCF